MRFFASVSIKQGLGIKKQGIGARKKIKVPFCFCNFDNRLNRTCFHFSVLQNRT